MDGREPPPGGAFCAIAGSVPRRHSSGLVVPMSLLGLVCLRRAAVARTGSTDRERAQKPGNIAIHCSRGFEAGR